VLCSGAPSKGSTSAATTTERSPSRYVAIPPPRPLSLGLCMTVMSPPQDILKLVSATPRLKYLETHTLRAVDVASIAATLRKCRGGAPLITHLISDPDGNFVS
jgi:hypothetical protein